MSTIDPIELTLLVETEEEYGRLLGRIRPLLGKVIRLEHSGGWESAAVVLDARAVEANRQITITFNGRALELLAVHGADAQTALLAVERATLH